MQGFWKNYSRSTLYILPKKMKFLIWGVGEQIIPVHEDANELSFDQKRFAALVSIDSYHYFAGKINFFENKILPFLKNKSVVSIGIPGMKANGMKIPGDGVLLFLKNMRHRQHSQRYL